MDLEFAESIASQVVEKLKPYCDRIEIAGSIRRRHPFPGDIDLVCIPSNQGQFIIACQQIGKLTLKGQLQVIVNGVIVDLYIATPETWATMLLIRTGSKEHNKMLCIRAQRKGMKLHADGRGLFTRDVYGTEHRIAGDTEASIFEALGLKYVEPEKREC